MQEFQNHLKSGMKPEELVVEKSLRLDACWTGSEYIHKFITLLPKDYYLIPGNGAIKLVGPDLSIYTSL